MPGLMIAAGIFHPEPGGPATYLKEILPSLQNRGWRASVLTYGDDSIYGYPYPVKRIKRQVLPIRLMNYWLAAQTMIVNADLIYAHTIDLPVSAGNIPRVIKIVGDQAWERCIRKGWVAPTKDIDAFQTDTDSLIVERQKKSRSKQVNDFDAVIVPSNYLKKMVTGWGVPAQNIHVIYNAMPRHTLKIPATQELARAELGWDDTPTILTAARLSAWKGIDHLINAVQKLDNVRLIVAGDGDQMPRLQEMAKSGGKDIQLLGHVPREKLYQMMKAADYFALYSGYEGLPHTILESLRVGTPVIASDKGGNPEVVRHDENGFLVPYVDVDALAESIQKAIDPATRQRLSDNSQIGMERFAFQTMVEQTDKILRHYLRQKS